MTKLAFCDYHNMVAILENTEHNTDFHQIVDFLQASHIRYALTVSPTVYVSHIRQFWSTARIETTDGVTNIVAKINGKQRTISESSIRRHLKLNDEEGISTLPDNELFENLSLMGYNILPNQRFSFQKGQFSCQWKFLIHTIMQCLSPKSTSFNEFSSNIATALVCLATNRTYNFSKMIFDGMMRNVKSKGKFLMYPRFIEKLLKMSQFGTIKHSAIYPVPFQTQKVFTTLRVNSPSFSGRTVPLFDTMIVQQDETAPPTRGDRYGEAFPTATSLDVGQDRENIPKTSAMPHESFPRVTSLGGDEGSLKQKLKELMKFCTTLQSQQTQMAKKIQSQDLEIKQLKARIQTLEDAQNPRKGVQEDAPNRGGIDQGEVNVFKASRGLKKVFTTASPQIPPVSSNVSTAIATDSEKDPTAEVLTTARDTTPYTRRPRASREVVIRSTSPIPISIPSVGKEDKRKWKEIMTEPEKSAKAKVQEQMSLQLARELQEEFVHEDQSIREQIERDAEIARIHAEEDLRQMINELDRSNVMINKHMAEYEEAENDLTITHAFLILIKSKSALLQEHTTEKPDHHDPNAQDNMKQWKNCCFHKFTMIFCYGKDVTEMQSLEIDDMLRIRVREADLRKRYLLRLTLLEFARRLGLYQAIELEEDAFSVYFEGGNPILRVIHKMITYGLCQRTTGYDKVQKNDLWLLSMFDARHQNGYANVAWVIARWMKRKGAGTQKESQIYCGQFISKLARKCRVLTEDVVRSLSAPIYCRDLDIITLRDLINSDGKLIPEDPQPGVPRVGIPRPPRASMQDLYDRMGRMEIHQDAIERMEYRQSEPTTHLATLSRSMTGTISSTHHHHRNNNRMMTSSVEMTRCSLGIDSKICLRACPHHGDSQELHHLDTIYNALNVNDQDSFELPAGGTFLDNKPADCSSTSRFKSKRFVTSRSKAIMLRVDECFALAGSLVQASI
ncbi:hypothetical protein Tco_1419377 [Tanacetum coccineum]